MSVQHSDVFPHIAVHLTSTHGALLTLSSASCQCANIPARMCQDGPCINSCLTLVLPPGVVGNSWIWMSMVMRQYLTKRLAVSRTSRKTAGVITDLHGLSPETCRWHQWRRHAHTYTLTVGALHSYPRACQHVIDGPVDPSDWWMSSSAQGSLENTRSLKKRCNWNLFTEVVNKRYFGRGMKRVELSTAFLHTHTHFQTERERECSKLISISSASTALLALKDEKISDFFSLFIPASLFLRIIQAAHLN